MEMTEASLHERYKAYRVNGEWFELPDVQPVINDLRGIRVQEYEYSLDGEILEQLYAVNNGVCELNRTMSGIGHELSRIANILEHVAGLSIPDDGTWWNSIDFHDVDGE